MTLRIFTLLICVYFAVAADITLNCTFILGGKYTCNLQKFEYLSDSKIVAINGKHSGSKSDEDVEALIFSPGTKLFRIPGEILKKFKNIDYIFGFGDMRLDVLEPLENCDKLKEFAVLPVFKMEADAFKNCPKLESLMVGSANFVLPANINIPSLKEFTILNGNITEINRQTFQYLKNLVTLAVRSPIEVIDAEAFEKLEKLESLHFSYTNLKSLRDNTLEPLNNLKSLSFIENLSDYKLNPGFLNQIKQLKNLEELQLTNILNGNFPIENLTNLRVLNLKNNSLPCNLVSCVKFENLFELTSLNLANNEFRDIDENTFRGAPFLEKLYLTNNQISSLKGKTFRRLKVLETLNLNFNQILEINDGAFEGLARLENLDLGNNMIEDLESTFLGLRNLVSLNLNNNKIKVIKSNTFRFLGRLMTVDLSSNEITELEQFAFYGLNNLRTLNLDNNRLTNIVDLFTVNLNYLEVLYLRNNMISNVLNSRFSPKIIHLENNQIKEIGRDTFRSSADPPREVYFTNNEINSVHPRAFNNFKGIHKLNFENSTCVNRTFDTSRLDFEDFMLEMDKCFLNAMSSEVTISCTSFIDIYNCKAELVTFKDPKDFKFVVDHLPNMTDASVTRLNFEDSRFPEIPSVIFERFSSLRKLDVSFVGLETLNPLNNCENLDVLDVSHNNIKDLSEDVFQNCQKILSIDLSYNKISTIEDKTFHNLPKLQTLIFSSNNISEIKREFFLDSSIRTLNLADNIINSIQRRSFDDVLENISAFINLTGNLCISKMFAYPNKVRFDNDLENCYINSGSGFLKVGITVLVPVVLGIFWK